jgi:hypothetical protein
MPTVLASSVTSQLSDTHSIAASELRVFGDTPQMYAPGLLAIPAAAQAVAHADAQRGALSAVSAFSTLRDIAGAKDLLADARKSVGPIAESCMGGEVLFLAAPSSIANSAGILIEGVKAAEAAAPPQRSGGKKS